MRTQKAEQLLRSARLVIPAGFLLVLVAMAGVAIGLARSRQADMLVLHTLEVEQSAETLLIDIRDAETNKRSFLLTNAPDYMQAFLAAMQAIPQELGKLRGLTADNPDQRVRVGELADKLAKPVESALKGANSTAQLTQRLLAYSRRQALEPSRVDLNRLVPDMLEILRRAVGEDISIETVLGAGLWSTFVDAHQVENALLNLALNAKAAMPKGGHLTIETANCYLDDAYVDRFGDIEAGQYVLLCVTDTGTGIKSDVLDRVFEPFFTTKPRGEGSGLGLAMVHGFVKQSGGHVRIYSEEDHGTTMKIYLPRATGEGKLAAVPAGKRAPPAPTPKAKTGETVLLVEDNEGVRDYASEVLQELGYRVLAAGNASEALRLLTEEKRIDLLFTDVILPGAITGRVLADQARDRRPGLPVLFTTGYTRNAIVHQGRLDPDVHLLNKPYTQQDLARKVRVLLDA